MKHSPHRSNMLAGSMMLISAIGTLAFILHHPTFGASGFENAAAEIGANAPINQSVHGAMILFLLMYYYALSILSDVLDIKIPVIRAAQLFIGCATLSMVGAALLSGFVTTHLAGYFIENSASDAQFRELLRLIYAGNQSLALCGMISYALAILFWSVHLIPKPGLSRIIGFSGVFSGAGLLLGLASGHLGSNIHGMIVLTAILGIWSGLVAIQLIRQKL